ncbi:serine/threonine-protein phosphatase 4 regulatory subunit 4-like isoform X3 [Osmia bicornis bicornis]|uniref:serine/threonine-protein phosphatase 4 regulatory subunit 4-like isoform X3 n=1 Tax=Osmia bicornis bicornis TaxID=1437191 RepID=UPI001EAF6A1A|nr:serine/threonine-protein phosphatase 4 regulatory subunit 4-like isoform X3 [Osmia bicornis bicornis]
MLQEEALFNSASPQKGDEIQKLNFIQTLPNLLATDTESCMTRVIPKVQQSLSTASTEFHIAASSTFKTILEQRLVSYNVFSRTFLQSILNSLEKRDPVICHAWLETLLDVIELLPVEIIRKQILPLTISKGQLSQPVHSRIKCSTILGKICTRFDSALIQKEVLPMVHSLCQDVNSEVRASICLQLRFVAEGLGAESVKPALLPSLVELANDEEINVRCASVQIIAHLLPHLQEDSIKTIIVPLIKKLCENSMRSDDNVICVIAQEYGKIVLGVEKCLSSMEKTWFLKYFQQLAQMGILTSKKESKPNLPFNSNPAEDEKYVECRRCCAFNLPAMFMFVSNSSDDTNALLHTFTALASDHYYLVRRTVACGVHEVAKVLGSRCGEITLDVIKLLKDNSEEVLQGLVPNLGVTLDCLAECQVIGIDRAGNTVMEIGRALLKCESGIAATHNWRLAVLMYSQLEILPKYFSSDFIYSYFVPMAFFRILHARPIPVRLAAGTLFLFLLRYNTKSMQKVELRIKLYSQVANNPDCYVRMMFVRMMVEAMEIFSSVYFKEHFYTVLLNLAEDSVPNIRLKVVSLLPQLKSQLRMPTDKKLLTALETTIRHLRNSEKDRDVLTTLAETLQKLEEIEIKFDTQHLASTLSKQDAEDARKLEEEKRLSGMTSGKSPPPRGATTKRGSWRRTTNDTPGRSISQSSQDRVASPRQSADSGKGSSMPEIPVMLSDDEFLVDAGIRIPAQFSQSVSKIPHLQDSVFGKRRTSFNVNRAGGRTTGMSFDKGKPKRNSSVEYEDCIKRKTNGADQANNVRTSIDCEDGLSMVKQSAQQLDKKNPAYLGPMMRSRFGFGVNHERPIDDKMKRRNSLILDKEKPKVVQSKCMLDRTKRHSANFSLKLLDSKETKPNLKEQHSMEVTDYASTERLRRALRRYSTLDVNHNQGHSKIPLRSFVRRSRTAPATRASSPVSSQLRYEEIDKLCRKFQEYQLY